MGKHMVCKKTIDCKHWGEEGNKKAELTVTIIGMMLLAIRATLSHRTSCSNTSIQGSVPHTSDQCFSQVVHLLGIVRTKGCSNGWSVIHPAFQLKLTYQFRSVGFCSTLGDLVSSHIGFVQIMRKIDGQFDEKIALGLGVIRIVEPIIKIRLRSEPEHGMRTILDPKALFPFLHDNSTK